MSPQHADTATDRAAPTVPSPPPDPATGRGTSLVDRGVRRRRHLRRLGRRHPRLLGTAVILLVTVIGLSDLLSGTDGAPFGLTEVDHLRAPSAVPYVLSAALAVALWWRRRAPALVFLAVVLATLVQEVMGLWLAAGVAVLVALYTVARYGAPRHLGWATAVAMAHVTVPVLVLLPGDGALPGLLLLLGTEIATAAVGVTLRTRELYLTALEDRNRHLEIERDQREQLIVAAERAHVAREMHDIVGHSLSVMVTLADGAATLAARRGEQSEQALRILGDTGRQAMSELRRVLGVLREDRHGAAQLGPQPGIRDLGALLSRVRAAGLAVTHRTAGDLEALGGSVQLTVYRIVQEALANTLKHAGAGSTAEVTVTADAGRVRLRVADTGAPPGAHGPSPRPADAGHGMIGIRQRAALYGGTTTIGPRADRPGWLVDVVLDASDAPAPTTSGEEPLP